MTETPPRAAAARTNDFDALRLLGAVLVIVGHAYILVGDPAGVPEAFGIQLHPLGVAIFFAISGYLIMGSWMRRPELGVYVTSRAARILPALAVVTIVTVLVVGPVFTVLSLGEYATAPGTWLYLVNVFPVLPQYQLPGVFEQLPFPGVVNGSIWTLRAEFLCYVAVVLVGLLPARVRPVVIAVVTIAAGILAPLGLRVADSDLSTTAEVLVYFGVGAFLRAAVPRSALRGDAALVALVAWGVLAWLLPELAHPLSWVLLPYVVLSIGLTSTPVVRRAARFGDLSYGVYLWAFPVQQALLHLAPGTGAIASVLVVTPISALLALASWHLVEKRAMIAKDRLPWMRRRVSAPSA